MREKSRCGWARSLSISLYLYIYSHIYITVSLTRGIFRRTFQKRQLNCSRASAKRRLRCRPNETYFRPQTFSCFGYFIHAFLSHPRCSAQFQTHKLWPIFSPDATGSSVETSFNTNSFRPQKSLNFEPSGF